jgi:hypothetical protein
MTTWIGELSHLPAGKVVECVTCSALNAAVRAGFGSPSFAERERLRIAEGAPANAGTDFAHAAAGLYKLYKLATVESNNFAAIQRNVGLGKSVLIRGTYSALPSLYRFQGGAVDFSHCILLVPGTVAGSVFVVDPLDHRSSTGQPIGRNIPWKYVEAFCATGNDDCLVVPGPAEPLPKPPAPKPVPVPAPKPVPAPAPAPPAPVPAPAPVPPPVQAPSPSPYTLANFLRALRGLFSRGGP